MTDTVSLVTAGLVLLIAVGWAILLRRKPKRPKPTNAGFMRMEG